MILTNTKLYSDLPFFISKNSFTEDFNLIKSLSCVKQSVKNLILTNYGERPFNYKLGGNIYDKLFESLSYELIFDLQESIGGTIQQYESRINVTEIRVIPYAEENRIEVLINYYIPFLEVSDQIIVSIIRTR